MERSDDSESSSQFDDVHELESEIEKEGKSFELSEESIDIFGIVKDIGLKEEKLRAAGVEKMVNSKISKFYPIDKDDELEHDVDTDELEEVSEDEKVEDNLNGFMDDNKKVSQQSAKKIHAQMA